MDFLTDLMPDAGLDPDTDRLVRGLLKRYGQFKLTENVGESLMDRLSGKHAYDEENRDLDLRLKRRALGLQDSEDFDESRNGGGAVYAAGLGGALQAIPEPGFLSPKYAARGKSLLSNSISLGEKYVVPGIIGRIARAIR